MVREQEFREASLKKPALQRSGKAHSYNKEVASAKVLGQKTPRNRKKAAVAEPGSRGEHV